MAAGNGNVNGNGNPPLVNLGGPPVHEQEDLAPDHHKHDYVSNTICDDDDDNNGDDKNNDDDNDDDDNDEDDSDKDEPQ